MKRIIFALALFSVSTFSFAQKGSWYIGGNAGFSSYSAKSRSTTITKATRWSFSPEVGTWFSDHVQAGVGLTLRGTDYSESAFADEIFTGGTLYGRYWWKPGSTFRPFAGLNIPILPGKRTENNIETNIFNVGANLNAGFGFALSPRVTAVGSLALLGFNSQTSKVSGIKLTENNFDFMVNSLGQRFDIGIYLTL